MQVSLEAKFTAGSSVNVVGPPLVTAVWAPELAQEIVNQVPATFTGSLKAIETFASTGTSTAPFVGVVDCTAGAWSAAAAVTEMSSTPTHSSLPTAFVVMIRSWTSGWLSTAAGSETFTAVTSVARLGPVEASATNAAGTLV